MTPKTKLPTRRELRASASACSDEAAWRPRGRMPTRMEGLDRVLGGGFVSDSTVLLSGPRGIGMTTFALQLETMLCQQGASVLHVSTEQYAAQLTEQGARVGADPSIRCLHALSLSDVIGEIKHPACDPDVVVIDTLGMFGHRDVSSMFAVAHALVDIAKRDGRLVIFIAQAPAAGSWAWEQQIVGLVDVWLRLSAVGQRRRLTSPKNQCGNADMAVDFEMTPTGLRETTAVTGGATR